MTHDTTRTAGQAQREVFARMTPGERVEASMQMSDEAKQIALEGIRSRHPEFDDAAVHVEWLRILYGEELTKKLINLP